MKGDPAPRIRTRPVQFLSQTPAKHMGGLEPSYTSAMGPPPQGTLEVAVVYHDGQQTVVVPWIGRPAGWYCTRANDPIAGPFQSKDDALGYRTKVGWAPA